MRLLPLLLAAILLAAPIASRAQSTSPVVLELFTSQGCSSCPPADALLEKLAGEPGVIALALHVDYWDYLGWEDPFGRHRYSQRQKAYAKAAKSRRIYTPQMIVQGQDRLIGHDAEEIAGSIAEHRSAPPRAVLEVARDGEDGLAIRVAPLGPPLGAAAVHVVQYLPSAETDIEAGENAGRRLRYTNIVTAWETVGQWDGESEVELSVDGLGADPVAVIVQRSPIGAVVTAVQLP
jgi:hypothetical protein